MTKGGTEFDPTALGRTEARFWREQWDAVPTAVATEHGMRSGTFGPIQATVIAALPEVQTLNLILGGARGDAVTAGYREQAREWVRDGGARGCALLPRELPGTRAAEAALAAAGYERTEGWMRFVRDAHAPRFAVASDVEVVEVDDDDSPFGTIAALGFSLPAWVASLLAPLPALADWRCYLALIDGEPQACAAMLLDGEIAELGVAATIESGRRRGCQLARWRRRSEDAAAAGVSTLFVETGERVPGRTSTSYGNILRAGFEEASLCSGWTDSRPPDG